jgi:hypothetical protein
MRVYLKKIMVWQCWPFATSVDIKFGRGLGSVDRSLARLISSSEESLTMLLVRYLERNLVLMIAYLKKFMVWHCWLFATSVDIKFGRGLGNVAHSLARLISGSNESLTMLLASSFATSIATMPTKSKCAT